MKNRDYGQSNLKKRLNWKLFDKKEGKNASLNKTVQSNFDKNLSTKRSGKSSNLSISGKLIKRKPTKQPSKPADIRIDPNTENEGSSFKSFKTGKLTNMRVSPVEAKQIQKSPSSFIERRHLSIQISLISKSDCKRSKDLD